MTKERLIAIQENMLFLTIIFLPIYAFPARYQILGGGGKLSYYAIMIGFFCFMIEIYMYGLRVSKKMLWFLVLFILWKAITTINGLIIYPYYDEVKIFGIDRLTYIFSRLGIHYNNTFINFVYLFFFSFKNSAKEVLTTFPVLLWVYHLYKDDFNVGFSKIKKYIFALGIALGVYAIPEVLLFKFHCEFGLPILQTLTPLLSDVGSYMGWYPPIVWPNEQLKSYCAEPSIFGYMSGIVIPFLWLYFIENKSSYKNMFYVYFVMLIFMTKSRTANLIFLIELIMLHLLLYLVKRKKALIAIVVCSALGFGLNLNLPRSFIPSNKQESIAAKKYYNDNIKTIVDKKARSNGSRLINIESHLNVIVKHPFLGTGTGLKDLYVKENLVSNALDNPEIRAITNGVEEIGVNKFTYGNVNQFSFIATNNGIIGLLFYLFPIFYIIFTVFKQRLFLNIHMGILIIILFCLLAAGVTGEISVAMYIILGLMYADVNLGKGIYLINDKKCLNKPM